MQKQRVWHIADVSRFVDTWDEDDPGYEYVEVDSKEKLEAILRKSMTPIGTVLGLESDDGVKLVIGLSKEYGYLSVLYVRYRLQKRVRSREILATEFCLFRSEGVVSEVLPEDLMPAEEVILAALHFFENGSFPDTVVVDPG